MKGTLYAYADWNAADRDALITSVHSGNAPLSSDGERGAERSEAG